MRDKNETIYRITVEDIYLAAENTEDIPESALTEEVIEAVCHKIEAMDFSDMSQTIAWFIEDAIAEVAAKKGA